MRHTSFIGAALISAAMAIPAFAADAVVYEAASETTAYNWSGVYVGIQAGYQWRDDDVSDPAFGPPPLTGTISFDGAAVGGHLGYDYQMGSIVLGVVTDIEWADGDGVDGPLDGGVSSFGYAEANWQGSVRARVGAHSTDS